MQIHGPDPGFVRPVDVPPPPLVVPNVQSAVAVAPAEDTQSSHNDVKFQDPNRDGRRSLYQEMGGKYVGFFRTKDLNTHRPITLELDFGLAAARQDYVVAMEAFLDTGTAHTHHGVSLTAHQLADDLGKVVATFPPLAKVLADPMSIAGFHVYAFPLSQTNAGPRRDTSTRTPAPGKKTLNTRPRPGLGDRFDGSA